MYTSNVDELSLTQRTMICKDLRRKQITFKSPSPQTTNARLYLCTSAWKIVLCLFFILELFVLKAYADAADPNLSPISNVTNSSLSKDVKVELKDVATSLKTPLNSISNSSLNKEKQVIEQNVAILPNEENDEDQALPDRKINSGALLRGFYVLMGLGLIVIIYVALKTLRLRRRQATRKYRPLSRGADDQEMFPLAADDDGDDDDDEIFNAADHQGQK